MLYDFYQTRTSSLCILKAESDAVKKLNDLVSQKKLWEKEISKLKNRFLDSEIHCEFAKRDIDEYKNKISELLPKIHDADEEVKQVRKTIKEYLDALNNL